MHLFTSKREKRLWLWAAMVVLVIYSTLGLTGYLATVLDNNLLQAVSFAFGLFLIAIAIVASGFVRRPQWREVWIILGIVAVYAMVLVRMGLQERTHLIEYSVLALLVYSGFLERKQNGGRVRWPALSAVMLTVLFGWLDEGIQAFLPNRFFDLQDLLFNTLAAVMAVGTIRFLQWIRQRIRIK